MTADNLTSAATLLFTVLPCLLVVVFVWLLRRAALEDGLTDVKAAQAMFRALAWSLAWLIVTSGVAMTGVLRHWERRPPPFALLIGATLVVSAVVAFGPAGTRLARHTPIWVLVAVQSFRLPLEVAMHRMYEAGVMPVQMSYSGRNWDILTGATAIVVAGLAYARVGGRRLIGIWNVAGLVLLLNVVVVAILGTPFFAYFGPDHLNTWVTHPPFVWLPTVMVLAALTGHLIVFRALRRPE